MSEQPAGNGYALVYQVIDNLRASPAIPPGTHGSLYRAIDYLRSAAAPVGHIDIVASVSATIQQLEWALRKCDVARQDAARERLRALGDAWFATPCPRA